jgi:hypothetical protein
VSVEEAQRLVVDFVAASRWVATDPELAVKCPLPEGQALQRRVAVGALLTGTMGPQRGEPCARQLIGPVPVVTLAGVFDCSGARCDATRIRELITARCETGGGGVPLGVLAEPLIAFTERDRDRSPW